MEQDAYFMQRCLELAELGLGKVAPNPLVGCVIALDGVIISEGFHRAYGEAHAEVNAIRGAKDSSIFRQCSLYVNLEPCSHFGKTPPCADLIVSLGFKRVVIAQEDPFPKVSGRGIDRLRQAGIEVELGVLEKEARWLNRRFNKAQILQRPFVILKWAQSADGYMDPIREVNQHGSLPVSSASTRKLVHLWRSQESGILVGSGTVKMDDPLLTVREIDGHNPTRIVLNAEELMDKDFQVFNSEAPTLLFTEAQQSDFPDAICIDRNCSVDEISTQIHESGIQSIIVEGGRETISRFLMEDCWDEIRVITAPNKFGGGLKAPELAYRPDKSMKYGPDRIDFYYRKS